LEQITYRRRLRCTNWSSETKASKEGKVTSEGLRQARLHKLTRATEDTWQESHLSFTLAFTFISRWGCHTGDQREGVVLVGVVAAANSDLCG
jgi:hypothetical protein